MRFNWSKVFILFREMKRKTKLMAMGLGLVGVGVAVAGTVVAKRLKNPITGVTWSSKKSGVLDIAWYDEEPNCLYKIYWSNRKGIRINDPSTYVHTMQVTTMARTSDTIHHLASIQMREEWAYFVIAKDGYFTAEFEAKLIQTRDFNVNNLKPEVLVMGDETRETAVLVSVLNGVQAYRIEIYLPNGTLEIHEFPIENEKKLILKFPTRSDSLVYISAKIALIWQKSNFLFYRESFSSPPIKWET